MKLSKFISGKPVIIINPKGIDYEAMKKLSLSTDDLFAALRECGYFNISQVQYAIMETNGKVSVMPKAEFAPATNADMKNKVQDSFIPIVLVSEGKIIKENIALAGLGEEKVLEIIEKESGKDIKIKDVLLLTVDQMGEAYLQTKTGEGKSFTTERLVNA